MVKGGIPVWRMPHGIMPHGTVRLMHMYLFGVSLMELDGERQHLFGECHMELCGNANLSGKCYMGLCVANAHVPHGTRW